MTNQPSVEQFHAQFSGRSEGGDDLVPWRDPGESDGGSWQEPGGSGENGDGPWEEPEWDEPRPAGDVRAPDWLTPARLRSVTFRRAPFGKRGLDEQQVNGFLDRVEEELTLLLREKNALAAEVARLREYIAGTQSGQSGFQQEAANGHLPVTEPISGNGSAPAAELTRVPGPPEPPPVSGASGQAELARVAGAPAQAEPARDAGAPAQAAVSRVHEAHIYAASILSQAQQAADQYMQEARQYSRELIEDARRRRTELLAKAVASGTGDEAWEQEANRLRAAGRHYRGNLRDYFQQLLANLDEWEKAEDAGLPDQPASLEDREPPGRLD